MSKVGVDFQEGFSDDEVVVTVDGVEVYRQENLQTDYSIGLADSVKIDVASLPCELKIVLPQKGLSTKIILNLSFPVAIGVSLQDDQMVYHLSDIGFLYF